MDITEFLNMQRQLQINMKEANPTQGGDPYLMEPEELAVFITWNFTALVKELGEALDEVGWKPWASSRHVHYPAGLHEMVDGWHFFLNIMLGMGAWASKPPEELGDEFTSYYRIKNAKNLQRQVEGYDGVTGKCPHCKRDLAELPSSQGTIIGIDGKEYCSQVCAEEAPKP